jgi:RNA polymerase sigma factor (sigma-70 family)
MEDKNLQKHSSSNVDSPFDRAGAAENTPSTPLLTKAPHDATGPVAADSDEAAAASAATLPYDDDEKREIEVLSHLENTRLISEYTAAVDGGDAELINKIKWKIVLANVPLIYTIAWPFFKRFKCAEKGFEIDDLVSLGYDGVLRAIITFDPAKNFTFGTYAGWWIRNYIVRYIHDNDRTMRLPQYVYEKIPKIRMAEDYFITQGHINCSDSAIAERLGWEEREVASIRKIIRQSFTSLDTKRGKEDDADLYNYFPDKAPDPENSLVTDSWHQVIRSLLDLSPKVKGSLKDGERCILKLRFGIKSENEKVLVKVQDNDAGKAFREIPVIYDGIEKTLEEIGGVFNVTRERIRQIELSALRKLRKLYYNQIIKEIDPSQISVQELALIQTLRQHQPDAGPPGKGGRKKKKFAPAEESENLKLLKRFIVDKNEPVG